MIKKIKASTSEKIILFFCNFLEFPCRTFFIILKINVYLLKIMIQKILILKTQTILQF